MNNALYHKGLREPMTDEMLRYVAASVREFTG